MRRTILVSVIWLIAAVAPALSEKAPPANGILGFRSIATGVSPVSSGEVGLSPYPDYQESDAFAYAIGADVTVTAIPAPGFVFSHWSGEYLPRRVPTPIAWSDNPHVISPLLDDYHVTANFVPEAPTTPVTDPLEPREFLLRQNSPNPFGSRTFFSFSLPRQAGVSLVIYDLSGRRVRSLANGSLGRGTHGREWDGTDQRGNRVGNGVYLALLRSDGRSQARRICLVR